MLPYGETFSVFIPDTTFGFGAADKLGETVKRLGGQKPLIITDEGIVRAGLLKRIENSLKNERIEYGLFTGCQPDAPLTVVDRCVKYVKAGRYDLLIAVGGGSIIDTAKITSVAAVEDKPIAELIDPSQIQKPGLRKIYIPTTTGTAAEWTPVAVVTNDLEKDKTSKKGIWSNYFRPDAVFVDPYLTVDLPQKITAQTGIDTLSHGIEPFTSNRASLISDMISSTCIRLVAQNLRAAYGQGGKNLEARYNMSIAASLGFAFSISGGGITHGMCNPLQMKTHLNHGEAISIVLPPIMEFNMIASLPKYAQIAVLMGEDVADLPLRKQAERGVQAIRDLAADLGLPRRMGDVGVKKDDIPGFVDTVFANHPALIATNARTVSKEEMKKIYEAAL